MKRFLFLLLTVMFLFVGCKTMLTGLDMQSREPTPEDIALANATAPGEDEMDLAEQSQIAVGLVKVREADGSPAGWVKQVTFSSGTVSIDGSDATVTIAGVSPGSGSMTTIQEQDTGVGGADIVTLDFQEGFSLVESPDTEVNVSLDVTPSSGNATLIVEQDALQVKYDSTDLAEGTSGLTLAASPTIATSVAVGSDPADTGAIRLDNATGIYWEDATEGYLLHVDNTSLRTNLAFDITGAGGLILSNDETITNATNGVVAFSGPSIQIDGTNPTVQFDETDGTDWEIRVDDTGNSLEIGSSTAGVGDNVELEIDEDGDLHVTGDLYPGDDIFVTSGGVINFNSGDVTITHSANALAFAGVTGNYTFDDAIDITGSGGLILSNDETITNATDGYVTLSGNLLIPDTGTIGSASDNDALSIAADGDVDVVNDFTAGTITSDAGVSGTTVTASTGFVLGDGDYIGITGNEIITFNAAGSIVVTGATMDVDGAFTASTLGSDGAITAATNVVIGDAGNIGSASDADAIAIAANGEVTLSQELQAGAGIDASGGTVVLGTVTGTINAGGATALEIPNGTANPASTTGSIALDTDGDGGDYDGPTLTVSTNGATMGYALLLSALPSDDNYILKYDAATDTVGWEADVSAGTTALDDIADPDAAAEISMDDTETLLFTSAQDTAGSVVTIRDTDADVGNQVYLLDLDYSVDDGQALADYIIAQDAGGTVFTLGQNGDITTTGGLDITGATELTLQNDETITNATDGEITFSGHISIPDAGQIGSASDKDAVTISAAGVVDITNTAEASAIGTAALTVDGGLGVAKDIWVGDDLTLDSDATIISLGADQDVTLTHVADTGILLNAAMQLQLRDSAVYVSSANDGYLDLEADTAIRANGPLTFANEGELNLPSSDASPDAAGEIRHDSTVTGLATGALAWYDGDEVRYLVDLDSLPVDDGYVVAYNATNDNFEMVAAGTGDVTDVGTCSSGACLDGSSDGGTTISLYDGDSHKLTIDSADLSADATIVLGSNTNNLTITNGTATVDLAAGVDLNLDVDFTADGQKTTITGAGQANTITLNEGFTIGDGNTGTLAYSAASKTLTVADNTSVNQDLLTSSNVTFASIDTGDGANELFSMDQDVQTTDTPVFAGIDASDAIILSDDATIDQSANNVVDIAENSDSIQFGFGGTDLDIVWSDGVLNLRNNEDSVNAIVEIEGKDAGERGELRVLSDGDDKEIAIYHDDTNAWVAADGTTPGDIIIAPDGDEDDYLVVSTENDVTSISVPGSTGTLGTAAAEWDALYLNDSGVIYGENDQSNTITSSATGWTFNQAITAVDAEFTGTTTVATLTQSAVAAPTWTASDSSTSADGTFDIKVDAATADYAGVLNFYVDEGDGAGADGAEDVLFMTINGSGANSTASGTIEFERIGNFEMGLSSSAGTASAGFIDLYEDEDETGSNYVRIQAPVLADTYTLTLPTTDGAENQILKTDGSGTLSWTSAGTATAWDDIGDPDNNGTKTITFDNAAEATVLSNVYDTAGSFFKIDNTDADLANNTYLLHLEYTDDGQANADFLKVSDNNGDVKLTIQEEGNLNTVGTVVATGGFFPQASDGAALGSDALDFSDLWLADGGKIDFDSGDLTLTHSAELLTFAGGAVDVDGAFTATSVTSDANVAGLTYGSDSSISNAELLTIDDGATTEILVGGGAGSAPVWTTATGTGAPVRAGSPTFTTLATSPAFAVGVSATTAGTVTIYDAGTIVMGDDGDNTTVTIGPVTDGTTTLGITGALSTSSNITSGDSIIIGDADVEEAELEILDGATLTTTEINYLDIASLGTGVASKAVVLDGSGNYTAPAGTWNFSGATAITIGALNLATTGTILGAVNVVTTTDGSESPTAAQMYGTMFIADHGTATSDTDYTLPTAAAGMTACFYDNGDGTGGIIVDAATDDIIHLNGTAITAANAIDSPGVAGDGANGDFICLMAIDDTSWITLGSSGTWVDGGAD